MFIFLNFEVSNKCQIAIRQEHTSLETFKHVEKEIVQQLSSFKIYFVSSATDLGICQMWVHVEFKDNSICINFTNFSSNFTTYNLKQSEWKCKWMICNEWEWMIYLYCCERKWMICNEWKWMICLYCLSFVLDVKVERIVVNKNEWYVILLKFWMLKVET